MSDLISRQAVIDHINKKREEHLESADLISRQAAILALAEQIMESALMDNPTTASTDIDRYRPIAELSLRDVPSAQPEQRWIPFKTRSLTDEEKEECPDYDVMLDCQLPENGQRILVNVKWNGHECVQMDEYYDDDGSYLDSGYEIGSEATAWMPLPEPYAERKENASSR